MTRFTKLALASAFATGLALPALAQTAPDQTAPPATTDSGIKSAAPDAATAKPVARHAHHIKHTTKSRRQRP